MWSRHTLAAPLFSCPGLKKTQIVILPRVLKKINNHQEAKRQSVCGIQLSDTIFDNLCPLWQRAITSPRPLLRFGLRRGARVNGCGGGCRAGLDHRSYLRHDLGLAGGGELHIVRGAAVDHGFDGDDGVDRPFQTVAANLDPFF